MAVARTKARDERGGATGGVPELQGPTATLIQAGKLLADDAMTVIKPGVKKETGKKAGGAGNGEEEEAAATHAACVSIMVLVAASRGQLLAQKRESCRCDTL